jgi:hypothetical protein
MIPWLVLCWFGILCAVSLFASAWFSVEIHKLQREDSTDCRGFSPTDRAARIVRLYDWMNFLDGFSTPIIFAYAGTCLYIIITRAT